MSDFLEHFVALLVLITWVAFVAVMTFGPIWIVFHFVRKYW